MSEGPRNKMVSSFGDGQWHVEAVLVFDGGPNDDFDFSVLDRVIDIINDVRRSRTAEPAPSPDSERTR